MESLRRLRAGVQRLAGRGLGQDTRPPRHTQGMMRWSGMEADVLRMPCDWVGSQVLQDATGAFLFVSDLDAVDGPALIQ